MVTRNVDPYTVIGGNPAKEIKKRFSGEVIEKLLEIKWWDWDIEKITSNLNEICGYDISLLEQAR